MKQAKKPWYTVFLLALTFLISISVWKTSAENVDPYETSNQETQLSEDDWKVIIDESKKKNDFGFIQQNLDTSNLADNGRFLLTAGIILIVLSGVGVVFFSICLYRLCKMSSTKRKLKHKGSRYK